MPTQGITLRALLIGLFLIPVVCIWNEYTEIVAEGTDLVAMSLIIAVVVLLFGLVLINLALKRWRPRKAFSQAELMTIYIMLIVSVGISGIGVGQFLVAVFFQRLELAHRHLQVGRQRGHVQAGGLARLAQQRARRQAVGGGGPRLSH